MHVLLSLHAVRTSWPVSDLIVVKDKVNIPRPRSVVPDKVLVAFWPLLLCVGCEHALQTDANALHIVYGAPTGAVEKVEADDAVGVDVRVPWYWMRVVFDKDYFGGLLEGQLQVAAIWCELWWVRCGKCGLSGEISYLDGVVLAEREPQPVRLAGIDRVWIDDLNVDIPGLEVVG